MSTLRMDAPVGYIGGAIQGLPLRPGKVISRGIPVSHLHSFMSPPVEHSVSGSIPILPLEIYSAIIEVSDKQTLLSLSRVSTSFCTFAQTALFRYVDLSGTSQTVSFFLTVKARPRLASLVYALAFGMPAYFSGILPVSISWMIPGAIKSLHNLKELTLYKWTSQKNVVDFMASVLGDAPFRLRVFRNSVLPLNKITPFLLRQSDIQILVHLPAEPSVVPIELGNSLQHLQRFTGPLVLFSVLPTRSLTHVDISVPELQECRALDTLRQLKHTLIHLAIRRSSTNDLASPQTADILANLAVTLPLLTHLILVDTGFKDSDSTVRQILGSLSLFTRLHTLSMLPTKTLHDHPICKCMGFKTLDSFPELSRIDADQCDCLWFIASRLEKASIELFFRTLPSLGRLCFQNLEQSDLMLTIVGRTTEGRWYARNETDVLDRGDLVWFRKTLEQVRPQAEETVLVGYPLAWFSSVMVIVMEKMTPL